MQETIGEPPDCHPTDSRFLGRASSASDVEPGTRWGFLRRSYRENGRVIGTTMVERLTLTAKREVRANAWMARHRGQAGHDNLQGNHRRAGQPRKFAREKSIEAASRGNSPRTGDLNRPYSVQKQVPPESRLTSSAGLARSAFSQLCGGLQTLRFHIDHLVDDVRQVGIQPPLRIVQPELS